MDKPQKTEQEQLNFFAHCYVKFAEAARLQGQVKFNFEIAGKSICLVFAGSEIYSKLIPALKHLRVSENLNPAFTIHIWESESSGVEMPEAPCDPYCFTHRGDLIGFHGTRIKIAYQWPEHSMSIVDLYANTAVFWIKSHNHMPLSVISAPFKTLLQWWFEKFDCQIFPGLVAGNNDEVIFMPLKKSLESDFITTTVLRSDIVLQLSGFNYFIIQLNPILSITKLYDDISSDTSNVTEKSLLKYILIPELHSDAITTIETISEVKAVRRFSFDMMTQIPCSGWQTLHFIRELLHKALPLRLKAGKDTLLFQKALFDLLNKPSKYSPYNKKLAHSPNPNISLIIPVFNGERFIREAVENVISQKYPALEIIIIDDGSTDHTEAIISSLNGNIHYLKQDNKGPASARNRGLEAATGEYIAFLDADDLFPESNLLVLAGEMIQDPKLSVVLGYAQILKEDPVTGKFECAGNPKESYPYYICAGLYRKSVFDKVGFFDQSLRFSEDTDWFLRAIELNCKIKRIEEVTLYVRRHENNMTKDKDLNELKLPLVIKRKLERKRDRKFK